MAALAIRNMERAAEAMERAMGWDLHPHFRADTRRAHTAWVPAMDILEQGDHYEIRLDLPGLGREELRIETNSGVLTISNKADGEPGQVRTFRRSIALPSWADIEKIEARLENGVLSIDVPKRDEDKPRTITVK